MPQVGAALRVETCGWFIEEERFGGVDDAERDAESPIGIRGRIAAPAVHCGGEAEDIDGVDASVFRSVGGGRRRDRRRYDYVADRW